jgi:hypothetical protein
MSNIELLINLYKKSGLSPTSGMRILEIGAPSVEDSFSFKAPEYNPFLVSESITCEDLERCKMLDMGAMGCLKNGNLFYSSGKENSHIIPYEEKGIDGIIRKELIVQSLNEFDIILSVNYFDGLNELTKLPNQGINYQLFIGFVAQNIKELIKYTLYYSELANRLNSEGNKCEFKLKDRCGFVLTKH